MKYTLKTSSPKVRGLHFDDDLNPEQRAVVLAPAQTLLVLAGAGSGKTRTLTARVAHLSSLSCDPEQIMLVTFTNRAANDMLARVESMLGPTMRRCAAGTFHHVGNRIIRRYATALGFEADFTILDPEDARDLLQTVIAQEGLGTLTRTRFPKPKVVAAIISQSVGTCRPIAEVITANFSKFSDQASTLIGVARRYQEQKQRRNLCDFDDLLAHWHRLLHDPSLQSYAEELQAQYQHVLVDEYQDINRLQGQIVDAMTQKHQSLTCVGDDAQSIYSFRGADVEQILEFQRRHPQATIYKLVTNYRSTPPIVELANRSIAHNRKQHRKELVAARDGSNKPAVIPLRDVYQQAEFVAQRVLELHLDNNLPLSKMAVLYRNHAHSLELQVELSRRQIPYSIRSGVRFFEQAHIKDVVAFLRARENRRDSLAWARMLRLWPGIGLRLADRFAQSLVDDPNPQPSPNPEPEPEPEPGPKSHGQPQLIAAAPNLPLHRHRVDEDPSSPTTTANSSGDEGEEDSPEAQAQAIRQRLSDFIRHQRGRSAQAFADFERFWSALQSSSQKDPGRAITYVLNSCYADHIARTWDNAATRREDIEHLAEYAERFENARSFLSELSLVQGVSAEQVLGADDPDDMLVLSTIHQSKGLEWSAVFVLGLVDGRFPMAQCIADPDKLAEERRLFYVAATRAKDELYLCYPVWGDDRKSERPKLQRVSRFVGELDQKPAVFERWDIEEAPEDLSS